MKTFAFQAQGVAARCLLFCFWIFFYNDVEAQYNWELKKQSKDISIYTAAVPGSGFKAFKGVTTISSSSIGEIAAIILDVENFQYLFPDVKNVKLLQKNSGGVLIHYLLTDAPWPVDDREGIYEIKPRFNKITPEVNVSLKCIEYDYPKTSGIVRMNKGEGSWKIVEKNGDFEVTYLFHADPAGKIPEWLANSFIVDQPFKTMQNLRKIIASEKYKNAKVDFSN